MTLLDIIMSNDSQHICERGLNARWLLCRHHVCARGTWLDYLTTLFASCFPPNPFQLPAFLLSLTQSLSTRLVLPKPYVLAFERFLEGFQKPVLVHHKGENGSRTLVP